METPLPATTSSAKVNKIKYCERSLVLLWDASIGEKIESRPKK